MVLVLSHALHTCETGSEHVTTATFLITVVLSPLISRVSNTGRPRPTPLGPLLRVVLNLVVAKEPDTN